MQFTGAARVLFREPLRKIRSMGSQCSPYDAELWQKVHLGIASKGVGWQGSAIFNLYYFLCNLTVIVKDQIILMQN